MNELVLMSEANAAERSEAAPKYEELDTKDLVRSHYRDFITAKFARTDLCLITVNFDARTAYRLCGTEPKSLTEDFLKTFRTDEFFTASREFYSKFFQRMSYRVLGPDRTNIDRESLAVVGAFENPGKHYDANARKFHAHFFVEIPKRRTFSDVVRAFNECFASYVMSNAKPADTSLEPDQNNPVHIVPKKLTPSTANYLTKQFVNFDIAANRLFIPRNFTKRAES